MANKLFGPLWGMAAAAVLCAAGTAQADDILWSYNAQNAAISAGSSSINFIGRANNVTGDSGVVIFNLSTTSGALPGAADHFNNNYSLNVSLSDTASLGSGTESGTLTFKGHITADVSTGAVQNFTNTYTTPTQASLVLGDDSSGWRKYTIKLDSFTPPGPPGDPLGAIHAEVDIMPTDGPSGGTGGGGGGGGGGGPQDSPEPASLVLAGFGLSAVGLAAMRRRQRKR